MDLPVNIEEQIVDYLNLEFGIYEETLKIKSSDLVYSGVRTVGGKEIRYWHFPCKIQQGCWATVEGYEDSYLIGVTTDDPNK